MAPLSVAYRLAKLTGLDGMRGMIKIIKVKRKHHYSCASVTISYVLKPFDNENNVIKKCIKEFSKCQGI